MSNLDEPFRSEFAAALAEAHVVCMRHVGADGLELSKRRTAVEVSMNLLVEMLKHLPEGDRQSATRRIAKFFLANVET